MSPGSKWSTRYGTQYRRLCARPGCSAPAVATLRFQSTERLAWLVELDDNSARTQGDLCNRHAAALVLPRGWELHDERESRVAAAEVQPEATAGEAASGTTRRTRARRKPAAERNAAPASQLPGLEPETGPGAPPDPDPERDPEREPETRPASAAESSDVTPGSGPRGVPAQFGTNEDTEVVDDELDEILDARTPLLRRAFRNAKPN